MIKSILQDSDYVIGTVTGYELKGTNPHRDKGIFCKTSRSAVGRSQTPVRSVTGYFPRVKPPGRDVHHSLTE